MGSHSTYTDLLLGDEVNYQIDMSDNLKIMKIQAVMSDEELKRILEREKDGLKGLNYRDCDIPQSHIEIISAFPFEMLDFRNAGLGQSDLAMISRRRISTGFPFSGQAACRTRTLPVSLRHRLPGCICRARPFLIGLSSR